ncbi:VRR-NUC domain-containing protein [Gammaproteobacteria bacterium]|nr:VRR-NUC domain-containing protein [Gammaproteobacteria bacterium]
MQPDLPETYYLDNVHRLFAHVMRVYADILEPGSLQFLQQFAELGTDAQMLCIRLLNRSRDCYRRGKLNYVEIKSLDVAIDELAQLGFIEVNGEIEHTTLLSLYTLAELRALAQEFSALDGIGKLRRSEFEQALIDSAEDEFFSRLAQQDDCLLLLCRDEYLLCQMLFFGNLNQSMTDFVLSDLGLYQYENYRIDPGHRPYRQRSEIQQHWMLYQLQTLYEMADNSDADNLRELSRLIPDTIDVQAPGFRKSEQLRYQIARQLERLGKFKAAYKLYRQCLLPPSRERRARIHDQRGKQRKALKLCQRIIAQPLDEQELQFACQFVLRLCKRHNLNPPESATQLQISHRPEIIDLELDYHESVELAVAGFYATKDPDGHCHYVENSLFNGVLGLLIWDVIFAPLPAAFYNPFQYLPSDFYAHDFSARRSQLLQQVWDNIDSNDDIWRIIESRWWQKQGLMNPLVNWQVLDLEMIQLALERIEHTHWRVIFERILQDLRNNRSGFPDLVYFPSTAGYCLIEVKGPGDSLQKNQQRWMQFFQTHGITHRLDRVSWRNH